ncbi:hypothetical protein QEZ47_05930 [Aminobacter anthyllidis]|uniref:hypothetical protein n=1 Tax=Aminobacter anthyllidis TaxID=1035067 RepID=UPI0024546548|nr:hypothetical protein [Aminobacter anthyllidis]MDH4985084.1 hypothetical protein [Aminobacter anthyllidis]
MFLSKSVIEEMRGIVDAIEAVTKLPAYRDAVLSWAPEVAQQDFGPSGALMGYDFHLGDDGPKLIEVNTNAGGAFLNALLAKAQTACCGEVEQGLIGARDDDFETSVVAMFNSEWRRQRGAGAPRRIAIIDNLYPEFILARQLLLKHGIDAEIGDASELHYEGGRLRLAGQEIDLVYNRLVDFDGVLGQGMAGAYDIKIGPETSRSRLALSIIRANLSPGRPFPLRGTLAVAQPFVKSGHAGEDATMAR